jgi:diguanylate cyclase (GGDEF)-like protein
MHQKLDGTPIPCEVTLSKVQWCGEENLIAFVRDLREINKAVAMVQQLEKAAFTDPLTGAFNRRYLIEESEKQIKLCGDAGLNYSLIMLDVDHFKQINDTYGHHIGDEVLKILVRRMRHSLKKDTLIARYGGEEFVITLPGASLDNALSTAERMRNTVKASNFAISGIELPITISLGVASTSHCGIDLQELLNNADKAMYKAKNSGRNTSVKYDASEDLRAGYVRTLANTE